MSRHRKLQVEERLISSLTPYANNARLHSKNQVKKLVRSVDRFGFVNPILVDDKRNVICGHGRLLAAIELGMSSVPTIMIEDMSEADRRAYIIADNKIAQASSWSKSMLRTELQGLVEIGYDVELTGFDTLEIDTMLSMDESLDADDVVQLPAEDDRSFPLTRAGDLWHIGEHRLLIGDARDPASYERLLGGERAQLILTDPPYGCRIENNVSGLGQVRHKDFLVGAGETSLPEFAQTLLRPAFREIAKHASSGAVAFVFCDWRAAPFLLDAAQGVFDEVKNLIVWSKTNAGMGTFYRSAHELIYAFRVSPGAVINNFGLGGGGRHRSNVWVYPGANVFRAGRLQDLADHPTVKPRKLCADAILECSKRNGLVLDPFAGSGTTLVAAALTGRRGYGIELDPRYGDVILRRLAQQAKAKPLLEGHLPLEAVAEARQAEAGIL